MEGAGIDEPAPLHRLPDPHRCHPIGGPENPDRGIAPHRPRERIAEIDKRHARPGPLPRLLEPGWIAIEEVAEEVDAHQPGRGEDVGGVERHLPGLRAARHGAGRPGHRDSIERGEGRTDRRFIAAENRSLEHRLGA